MDPTILLENIRSHLFYNKTAGLSSGFVRGLSQYFTRYKIPDFSIFSLISGIPPLLIWHIFNAKFTLFYISSS